MIFLSKDEKEDQEWGCENWSTYHLINDLTVGEMCTLGEICTSKEEGYHLKAKVSSDLDMKVLQNLWTIGMNVFCRESYNSFSDENLGVNCLSDDRYRDEIIYKMRWEVELEP